MPSTSAAPALAVDVINPRDLGHGQAAPMIGNPDYGWHLLAEGDSWFTIAAIPSSNLLFELRLAQWTQVLNLAYPGDTLRNIANLANNDDLKRYMANPRFAYAWDGIVLSGGGNDLIGAATALIRKQAPAGSDPLVASSYVDMPALATLIDGIAEGFRTIVQLRDSAGSPCRGRPVFLHTYDYATPRNAPARFIGAVPIAGPWLYRAFNGSGIDIVLQQRIANLLVDQLADALLGLDSDSGGAAALPAFHVLDTRNTLVMANPTDIGNSNDWLNEIHPNLGGYRKIAARLSALINGVLGA